ncbi:MAG: hypothetical protein AB9834_00445 [Lentimicrobium sp.]
MAETQVTGRQIKDKSVFDLDIDLTQAPVHPTLISSDRLVIVDPTDGNIKTSTYANLLTGLDAVYLRLSGGTVSGNLVVSGTTTLNAVTKVGTAMIPNLNADFLDGQHGSYYSAASHSHNLTDGIFDGNGLLYAPYAVQATYALAPAVGMFYTAASLPNGKGQLHYSGQIVVSSIKAYQLIYSEYMAYIGSADIFGTDEIGFYVGAGDQVIASMFTDLGYDYYNYANGAMSFDSYNSLFAFSGRIEAPRYKSVIGNGTAPIEVISLTVCTNLNADLLDGLHASSFAASGHTHAYEPIITAGTTAQYWRGDKTWQTMPAFPSVSASTNQILYMSGTNIVGSSNLLFKASTGDFCAGLYAQVGGGNSFAMGTNAVAYADAAIAIGYGSDSEGNNSICIGASSNTNADFCVVIGVESTSNANNGIAIGRNAVADNAGDITLGSTLWSNKTTIFGAINFPSIVTNGFLKILAGEVYVDAVGSGTVTSVSLSMPSIFTVSGSPVTTSGTLTAVLASQTKNYVLAAPQFTNGVPAFRALTADDMPDLSAMYDNYYSWGVKLDSGSQFNILKYGAAGYSNYYNGINFIAGTGVTLTASSVAGGALGITIDSSATVSGNEFTMIGRNTTGYGVYSELTPSLIMRLISNNSGSDQCSFFDASGVWSRRDSFVTTGASNVTYTGQTLTDITGLAIVLGANSTYEYEAMLSVQTSAVTTGIQYAIAYTAGYSQFSGQIIGSVNTSYSRGNVLAINTASSTFMTTSNQSGQILIKGYIKTSGIGGTLSIKHLKVTSGTSTVLPYSYFRVNLISTQ